MDVVDWFDVLDDANLPLLTEREVVRNLQAIINDADKIDQSKVRIVGPTSYLLKIF